MPRFRASAKRVLHPILYAPSVPLVTFSLVVGGVHRSFGYVPARAVRIPLAIGSGAVFVLLSSGLARLERPRPPGPLGHPLRWAILYAGLVLVGLLVVPELLSPWCCTLQRSIGAGLFVAAAYTVALDACTVYAAKRKASMDRPLPRAKNEA